MKQMLHWVADHATMTLGQDGCPSVFAKAAECAHRYHNEGRNLSIDLVEVEDRVYTRQHNTGVKSFDALLKRNQGTFLPGNVYGDAQLSQCVRPFHAPTCNGFAFANGVLRQSDLKVFARDKSFANSAVKRWLDHPDNNQKDLIVYAFRNKVRASDEMQWYGYLITDEKHNLVYRDRPDCGSIADSVLTEAAYFLTTANHQNAVPLVRLKDGELEILHPQVQVAYDYICTCEEVEALLDNGPQVARER